MNSSSRRASILRRTIPALSLLALALVAGALLASAFRAQAASTGETAIYFPQGEDAAPQNGDFVSSNGTTGGGLNALDTFYSYFIEVPSGLSRLVVDLFDADIGVGGSAEQDDQRDRARTVFNSSISYSLRNPLGIIQAIENGDSATDQPGGADDAWLSLLDTNFPAFAGSATAVSAANVTTLSVAKPTDTQTNDLLIFIIALDGNGAINTPTGGTGGWNLINSGVCAGGGGGACRLGVFWRLALVGDPATYTVTWTTSDEAAGMILRYTGVNTTTPIDVAASSATGTTAAPTAPSVTTVTANTRILRIYAADEDVSVVGDGNPYPTGLRGRHNFPSSADDADAVTTGAAETTQAAIGASGTAAFEIEESEQWRAVTVAIRPDTGNAANGHWELRIDPGPGDDLLATGIRAHDGDSDGVGGTELNVYYDSHNQFGVNPDLDANITLIKNYDVFSYVTSGCTFSHNDFDYDSNQANNIGNVEYNSRSGAFVQLFDNDTLATNDVWQRDTIPRWTTDGLSTDYGIWRTEVQIRTYDDGASGNYTNVYVGNFNVGANPPTQPMTNAFRVYLPTDTSDTTAPVKPYLEQLLTYVSGPNPPLVNQTTRVEVTVRLVNPTAQSIAFSTPTNIVTANVPGPSPAVVYRGVPVFTQGSIVSQPALGGIGNVTWNPGTVAAGQTVILAYRVDVTPTSVGQRLVVTGTPASNGTRATFVDQTGNTSQARATFTLGPICELAATQGVITHALLERFSGYSEGGRRVLLWETGSEVGSLGFEVHRYDTASGTYRQVGSLVPALERAPTGGVYRFVDEGVGTRERSSYLLVEVDHRGNRRTFGPYTVDGASDVSRDGLAALEGSFASEPRPESPRLAERLARHAAEKRAAELDSAAAAKTGGGAVAAKVGVATTGLHSLSAAQIAAALGTAEATVRQWIAEGRVRITLDSHQIAWLAAPSYAGVYFYGRAPEGLFSRENVYRVENKTGLQMAVVDLSPRGPALPHTNPATFNARLHLEQDRFAATVLPLDPASDYWFWEGVLAGHPTLGTKSFQLAVPGARPTAGDATLTVGFQGATDLGVAGEHEASVRVNGVEVGSTAWQGITAHQASFAFASSLLADGNNLVEVTGILPQGVSANAFYVDSFDLDYPRTYTAVGDALVATGDGRPTIAIGGFGSASINVYDVAQPNRPRIGKGLVIDGGLGAFRASFHPTAAAIPYLAVAPAGVLAPVWVRADLPSSLKATGNRADYVVIAPAELAGAANELADYRASQGLRTLVADLDDVYDEFSYSQPNPNALRDFLAWAHDHWTTAPRYAALAGDGSFDYRNLLGQGGNLVPPLMVTTGHGLFSSDARYGDLTGDGVPEIAIGRLPVLTSAELSGYVAKLAAYEAGASRSDLVALVADNSDQSADFGAQSQGLASNFEQSFVADELYLGPLTVAELRDRLFADIEAGVGLVNFLGHGGTLGLADESLLTPADVPNLGNGNKLFTLTGLTCALNRFELPGVSGLAEELLLAPEGGAAAVWAPSGLSQHSEAALLGEAFYRAVAASTDPVLGDAVASALAAYAATGAPSDMLAIYNLMGDPALVLQLERHATPPGPPAHGSGE